MCWYSTFEDLYFFQQKFAKNVIFDFLNTHATDLLLMSSNSNFGKIVILCGILVIAVLVLEIWHINFFELPPWLRQQCQLWGNNMDDIRKYIPLDRGLHFGAWGIQQNCQHFCQFFSWQPRRVRGICQLYKRVKWYSFTIKIFQLCLAFQTTLKFLVPYKSWYRRVTSAYGHTTQNIPCPIRTMKSTCVRPS